MLLRYGVFFHHCGMTPKIAPSAQVSRSCDAIVVDERVSSSEATIRGRDFAGRAFLFEEMNLVEFFPTN
jgi:hypothetical protein